jgi:penicillin G amidase
MSRWLKITIGVIVSLIIVLVVGEIVVYRMLKSSLPDYNQNVSSQYISADIQVYRDSMAIPYIKAKTDEDVAFALGYVHAQERMFTMDLARRAGAGRLSEIFGPETIPFDEMFRTVGIKRMAEMIEKKMDRHSLKILDAYSNGVNLYLNKAKGTLPVEFDILNYSPYKWRPLDCLIMGRMMAWELNISWWTDIVFTELVQELGEEKVKEILPDYPENAPYVIPPELKKLPMISNNFIDTDRRFRKFFGIEGTHIGSNNWVVNSKMSSSGAPIIANDPHLGYSAPGKWYAAVVRSNNWNASGYTLPGVPVFVIGKNQNISWVLTNIMLDDADFYAEKIDSSGKNYFYEDKWHPLQIIRDTIRVKDSSSVGFKIRITDHGPIISDIHPYKVLYPDTEIDTSAISMKWTAQDFSDEFTTFLRINKAKNWKEFREAFSTYSVPGQNFVYGDKEGNIGYIFGGKLPIRENENPSFIFDGTKSKYDWKGYVQTDEIPYLFNPPENYIASANNKTLKNFKYHISNLWEPPSRIERITQLLNSKEKHKVSDFMKYQMDFVSLYAKELTGYILNAFKNIQITDSNLKLALELLKKWNYEMNQYSQVPSIYAVFFNHLLEDIYKDKMGHDLYNEFLFTTNVPYRSIMQLMQNPNSSWFDDRSTSRIETRDEVIRKSLAEALTDLENRFGKNLKDWQWGKLHHVIFKHAFSGFSSLVDRIIDIGPFKIGGDGTTIFNTEYPFYESIEKFPRFRHSEFENNLGPSMRYIYDFSKPDEFYMILTTGESGNVMSNYYSDMTEMWLRGKYLKIKTDDESIRNEKYLMTIVRK